MNDLQIDCQAQNGKIIDANAFKRILNENNINLQSPAPPIKNQIKSP